MLGEDTPAWNLTAAGAGPPSWQWTTWFISHSVSECCQDISLFGVTKSECSSCVCYKHFPWLDWLNALSYMLMLGEDAPAQNLTTAGAGPPSWQRTTWIISHSESECCQESCLGSQRVSALRVCAISTFHDSIGFLKMKKCEHAHVNTFVKWQKCEHEHVNTFFKWQKCEHEHPKRDDARR